MTPYTWRLCCLSLAVLFVVQASTGLVLRLAAPRIVRYAEAWSPVRGAAVALGLRWLPGALGLFVAGFLCVPVYLRLEPLASDEELGAACVLLACGAVLAYAIPLGRAAWWVWRSEIRLRALLRGADEQAGIFVIHETSPAMALAGLFHSRVVVSRQVLGLLSSDQMEAARRHERAHLESRDNWKRLLIEAAPIDFGGSALRQAWGRFSEWAADDRATEGDSARSVALRIGARFRGSAGDTAGVPAAGVDAGFRWHGLSHPRRAIARPHKAAFEDDCRRHPRLARRRLCVSRGRVCAAAACRRVPSQLARSLGRLSRSKVLPNLARRQHARIGRHLIKRAGEKTLSVARPQAHRRHPRRGHDLPLWDCCTAFPPMVDRAGARRSCKSALRHPGVVASPASKQATTYIHSPAVSLS